MSLRMWEAQGRLGWFDTLIDGVGVPSCTVFKLVYALWHVHVNNTNNNKRPLTPKSMPPAGDEHVHVIR